MFDGTDLSAAYGTSLSADVNGASSAGFLQAQPAQMNMNAMNGMSSQLPPPPQSSATEQYVLPPPPPPVSQGSMSHATPPDAPYYPPNAMYAKGGTASYAISGDSMWDKLSSKKYDVMKLVLLSLVILLAMSSDRVVNFYLNKYISGGIFTTIQEFLIRLSYPLVILVLLWMLKASV